MADYHDFTAARATEADTATLLTQLRAIEATIGVQHEPGTTAYRLKTNATWTAPMMTQAQTAIDTAPERDEAALEVDVKVLKALALGLWECIPNPTLTKVQLRARILAIWKTL